MIVWIGGWLAACGSADIVNRETFVFKGATGSTAIQSLNGEVWMLAPDPQNIGMEQNWFNAPTPEAKKTKVPWIIQDAFPGYHGVAWYWRDFTAPANPHLRGRTLLRFWQVDYKADVWLNGQSVRGHEGGESPFTLDITEAVKPGVVNRLAVRVLNPSISRSTASCSTKRRIGTRSFHMVRVQHGIRAGFWTMWSCWWCRRSG